MGSKHLLKCSLCEVTTISSSSSSSSFLYHHLHTHHRPQLSRAPTTVQVEDRVDEIDGAQLALAALKQKLEQYIFRCAAAQSAENTRLMCPEGPETLLASRLAALKQKLEQHGFRCAAVKPAQNRLVCPKCEGGSTMERCLSLLITADCNTAVWTCHRKKCGWKGKITAVGVSASFGTVNRIDKATPYRTITEQGIGLEPLCEELLEYFMERMITGETLRRNAVMQKSEKSGDGVLIAFTYRRNGVLVSCKYWNANNFFWQEKNTERILYGLDDIKQVSDIIIVEGEIDKLSIEEAGFRNCVSVPDGEPPKVSNKDLPPTDEDTEYHYLWNCEEYFDKAFRIILATNADRHGQALAEELARHLGRERCWRVKWPMINEVDVCKDANEVLVCLGCMREVIDQAELYPIIGLFNFSDFFDEIDAYYYYGMG